MEGGARAGQSVAHGHEFLRIRARTSKLPAQRGQSRRDFPVRETNVFRRLLEGGGDGVHQGKPHERSGRERREAGTWCKLENCVQLVAVLLCCAL